jgi:hypothetical protein
MRQRSTVQHKVGHVAPHMSTWSMDHFIYSNHCDIGSAVFGVPLCELIVTCDVAIVGVRCLVSLTLSTCL